MRKLLLLLLLTVCFLFSAPALATINYVDMVGGDDGAGDGSTGNPYKTIDFAEEGLSGGDEVRVKKTTVSTASNTMTWTDGSVTVNTTADETGNISVGDVISKTSDFTGTEGWWAVEAIDSSDITLTGEYWGSTETVTTYYMEPDYDHSEAPDNPGTSASSRLKVTGGWDFTGPTRDGYTFWNCSTTASTLHIITISYVEYAYFVLSDNSASTTYRTAFLSSTGSYFHHMYHATTNCAVYFGGAESIFDSHIITGAANIYNAEFANNFLCTVSNIYANPNGSTIYASIDIDAARHSFFDNVNVYDAKDYGIKITGSSYGNVFNNITVDTSADDCLMLDTAKANIFYNCTLKNSVVYGIYSSLSAANNIFYNTTFSGNGSGNIYVYTLSAFGGRQVVTVDSSDNHVIYSGKGNVSSDTTDARSGTCVKFDPEDSNEPIMPYIVGSIKVASTANDITLKIYMKDDAGFNGKAWLYALQKGELVAGKTEQTLATSYVEKSITVSSSDLVVDRYLDLYIDVVGTAGNVFVDDFSWSQP